MSENDMLDRIYDEQGDIERSTATKVLDNSSFVSMFFFYIGLFQMMTNDPVTKLNGMFVFFVSLIFIAASFYLPNYLAALRVPGHKYLLNIVFYGRRMVPREMELVNDPLVVAKMDTKEGEEPDITMLEERDEEIAHLMSVLGSQFLTDEEVDEKIDQLIKERYEKRKEEKSTGRLGRLWKRIKDFHRSE